MATFVSLDWLLKADASKPKEMRGRKNLATEFSPTDILILPPSPFFPSNQVILF